MDGFPFAFCTRRSFFILIKKINLILFQQMDSRDAFTTPKNMFMSSSSTHSERSSKIRQQLEKDGKHPNSVSNVTLMGTVLVGVPLCLTTLLPMSLTYQLWKHVMTPTLVGISDRSTTPKTLSHSEVSFPEVSQLKPLSDRKYDVVLLGSTGFTGGLAAKYIASTYNPKSVQDIHTDNKTPRGTTSTSSLKWALAGRNFDKLQALKQSLARELQIDSLLHLPIIIADTSDPSTLHDLVQDTKVVISTAGPFCKYGSHVVEFCARYGTSYVDITGETGWNKEMIMKWDNIAQATGAIMVSLCGCDSIPWDLTYHQLSRLLKKECQDDIVKLQIYDELKGGISGGTIDTMLQFLEGKYKEPRYSMDPYYKKPNGEKSSNKSHDKCPFFPQKRRCYLMNETPSSSCWTIPWIMSTVNYEVIKRSHALNDEICDTKLAYEEYWVHDSFRNAFVTWFGTILGATALLNPLSGSFMKRFVLPQPGQGPTTKQMEDGYLLLYGKGEGANGSQVESEFYFPADPGYKETARMVVESGLCLALNRNTLPVKSGGFYPPSVAMGEVLLDRLCQTGCKFASRVVVNMSLDGKTKLHSKL